MSDDGSHHAGPDHIPSEREAEETLNGLCEEFETYVRRSPLKALAIAFLAGLAISKILL